MEKITEMEIPKSSEIVECVKCEKCGEIISDCDCDLLEKVDDNAENTPKTKTKTRKIEWNYITIPENRVEYQYQIVELFGVGDERYIQTVKHDKLDDIDYNLGFIERVYDGYIHPFFDFDSMDVSGFKGILTKCKEHSEIIGDYSVGAYSNDEEVAKAFEMKHNPEADHFLSTHIIFDEIVVDSDDLVKIIKSGYQDEFWGFPKIDPKVYNFGGEPQKFRHILSPKNMQVRGSNFKSRIKKKKTKEKTKDTDDEYEYYDEELRIDPNEEFQREQYKKYIKYLEGLDKITEKQKKIIQKFYQNKTNIGSMLFGRKPSSQIITPRPGKYPVLDIEKFNPEVYAKIMKKELEKENREARNKIRAMIENSKPVTEMDLFHINWIKDFVFHGASEKGDKKGRDCDVVTHGILSGLSSKIGMKKEVLDKITKENTFTDNAATKFDEFDFSKKYDVKSFGYIVNKVNSVHGSNPEFQEELRQIKEGRTKVDINKIKEQRIDMKTPETFDTFVTEFMGKSAYYNNDEKILEDMMKVFRVLPLDENAVIIKKWDKWTKKNGTSYLTLDNLSKLLRGKYLEKNTPFGVKKISIYDYYNERANLFSIRGIGFNSKEEGMFNIWNGWKYEPSTLKDQKKIQWYLDFILDVICDGRMEIFNYIINWVANMLQNPGIKNETALVWKGIQGAGKNMVTNIISELFAGFVCGNITKIDHVTGVYNGIMENKVLIILNEVIQFSEMKSGSDALKSLITDLIVAINEKYKPIRDIENVGNFIFLSNNGQPVKIEVGDRRYLVLCVNGKYKGNTEFFDNVYKNLINQEFYEQLMAYFMDRDLSKFNPRNIPQTEEKRHIIISQVSTVDQVIIDRYDDFIAGVDCEDILSDIPSAFKSTKSYSLALLDKCRKERKTTGDRKEYYILKEEFIDLYRMLRTDTLPQFETMSLELRKFVAMLLKGGSKEYYLNEIDEKFHGKIRDEIQNYSDEIEEEKGKYILDEEVVKVFGMSVKNVSTSNITPMEQFFKDNDALLKSGRATYDDLRALQPKCVNKNVFDSELKKNCNITRPRINGVPTRIYKLKEL